MKQSEQKSHETHRNPGLSVSLRTSPGGPPRLGKSFVVNPSLYLGGYDRRKDPVLVEPCTTCGYWSETRVVVGPFGRHENKRKVSTRLTFGLLGSSVGCHRVELLVYF